MAKRKGHEEGHGIDETWLIPYADLLTLLLALFVVLFAMSSISTQKLQMIAQAFNAEFNLVPGGGGAGIGMQGDSIIPLPPQGGIGSGDGEAESSTPAATPTPTPEPQPTIAGAEGPDATDQAASAASPEPSTTEPTSGPTGEGDAADRHLDNLYEAVLNYVDENGLDDVLDVQYLGENVLLVLKSDMWFASGSADVTPEMVKQADMLAQLILENQDPDSPLDVTVTGHTDNVPIQSSRFPSNWHLSIHRAVNFMSVLLEHSELDPTNFSCRGYGEFKPIATNDTPEGRQMNRRVELLVSK